MKGIERNEVLIEAIQAEAKKGQRLLGRGRGFMAAVAAHLGIEGFTRSLVAVAATNIGKRRERNSYRRRRI